MHADHAPRGFGRIIDRAFELYRANFRTVAIASLLVVFPAAVLVGITQVFSARGFLQLIGALSEIEAGGDDLFLAQFGRVQAVSALSNVVAPIFFAAQTYLAAALFAAAPRMLAGERPDVREFLAGGKRRFLWLLVVRVLVSMTVGVASIFLLVPGLIAWARLSVAHVATVVEGASLDRAFSRSWALTRDRFWRTVGFAVVVGAIVVALEAAVDSPAIIRQIVASVNDPEAIFRELSTGWTTFEGVLAATATSLIMPFTELCWFFYYLDLRARREGMDLVIAATHPAAETASRAAKAVGG